MTLTIRSLADSPHSYLASATSPYGSATFLLHFRDDIFGAMSLYEFAEILRKHYGLSEIQLAFRDTQLHLGDGPLLRLLRNDEQRTL
jgi:hypothetical protein